MANKCKDCGCTCKRCISTDHDVQLHVEIENLKQRLFEKENHIVSMETNFLNEANKFPNGELVAVREELITWQDKYKRLYEAHRRVQRVNQGLEDKLLKLVDVCETEKTTLTKDVATLSHKLAEANYAIKKLTEDNERYKNDVTLAIQFLQCKQSNFVAQRYDTLPPEVQSQVSNFMTTKKKPEERRSVPEMKNIKVPIPTFPPTAMVYSVPKSPKPERKTEEDVESAPVDIVSAAIMAKVLEERQRERVNMKHCDTCTCAKSLRIVYDNTHHTVGTQTGDYKEMLCLKCNDNVFASAAILGNIMPPNSHRQFSSEEELSDISTGVQIVRNTDSKTNRVVPIYPLESFETTATQTSYNIVKVQPNNFLLDKSKMSSKNSSLTDSNRSSPKTDGIPNIFSKSNETLVKKNNTHRLCDKIDPNHEIELNLEKADSEKNEDKVSAKTTSPKGPRYCSMRVQTGTKNILLDNAHNNVAPILYTRSHKVAAQKEESSNTETSSEKFNSMASDTSAQNQQRVAEWIQNNLEGDISSSDNSRSELLGTKKGLKTDKVKYAEMEENVKRFLFGESEFLKTVEIGKMKYQNIRDEEKSGSKVEPCSETDI